MRSLLAAALLGLAACAAPRPAPVTAPTPHVDPVAASLAAAESAFAAHSVREDMRAAFLAAFAEDGLVVRDGWARARAWFAARPAPPIVLDWSPRYVEVAAAGDLGLSTGPWKLTSKTQPDSPPAYGQFVSIWRHDAASGWKVEVDLGIAHPGPDLWDERLVARRTPSAGGAGGDLAAAEADFQRIAAARGLAAAYAARGADDLRLYRNGKPPRRGREAALAAGLVGDERLAWTVERVATARSGDFGYTRGAYSTAGAAKPTGYFVRAWRREAGGWRVILDVVAHPAG